MYDMYITNVLELRGHTGREKVDFGRRSKSFIDGVASVASNKDFAKYSLSLKSSPGISAGRTDAKVSGRFVRHSGFEVLW